MVHGHETMFLHEHVHSYALCNSGRSLIRASNGSGKQASNHDRRVLWVLSDDGKILQRNTPSWIMTIAETNGVTYPWFVRQTGSASIFIVYDKQDVTEKTHIVTRTRLLVWNCVRALLVFKRTCNHAHIRRLGLCCMQQVETSTHTQHVNQAIPCRTMVM